MKALLIYNPVAGQHDIKTDLAQVVKYLESFGWEVGLRETLGPGDALAYAREAVEQSYDMAIAVGGDGTLGEVANGLVGSDCVLGVLPAGTGNVWARMMDLPIWSIKNPHALLDAARILVSGDVHRIDVGKTGDRYFVLWTGIGFDAQVAREVEPHRQIRRNLGNLPYLVTTLALSLVMRGTRVTIVIDGEAVRQRALLILIANAQFYGGSVMVAPEARLDDGLLDVYVFKGDNTLDLIRHLVKALLGMHRHDPKVEVYQARDIEISGSTPLPLHLDGEMSGYTPVRIQVVPKALNVVVPAWASQSLFVGGASGDRPASIKERLAEHFRYGPQWWRQFRRYCQRQLLYFSDTLSDLR
ncbi:MAG: diacylglycerol kinase family lipid kinase [Chloroflexi bacterium]|nr:diacylglycerol kinase family lipid kinase [Chloroflexota bacterium]